MLRTNNRQKLSHVELHSFQLIEEFINSLFEYFKPNIPQNLRRPLDLYHRLISKISVADTELIKRQVGIFTDFCISNREAIQNHSPLPVSRVIFSDTIFIDVDMFLSRSTEDVKATIYDYLTAISKLVDPHHDENNDPVNINPLTDLTQLMGGDMFKNIMASPMFSNLVETIGKTLEDPNTQTKLMQMASELANGPLGQVLRPSFDNENIVEKDNENIVENID